MMSEENVQENPGVPAESEEGKALGKFKSVDALVRAYGELEAEFTRRSQRLKALEERERAEKEQTDAPLSPEGAAAQEQELYRAVKENEKVRAQIVGDYLQSLNGVPLMTGAGRGIAAPPDRPKSIRDAGALALGYLRNRNN